jgi:hypothetical protein
MLTKDEARELVVRTLCQRPDWLPAEDELVVFEEATIEKTWGWVFFYGSRMWRETHEIKYAIAGNAPVLVEKDTGKLIPTGTARRTEHYIERYEQTGDPHG